MAEAKDAVRSDEPAPEIPAEVPQADSITQPPAPEPDKPAEPPAKASPTKRASAGRRRRTERVDQGEPIARAGGHVNYGDGRGWVIDQEDA